MKELDGEIKIGGLDDLKKFFDKEGYVYFIGIVTPSDKRIIIFLGTLENNYFPIGTSKNNELHCAILDPNDKKEAWILTAIPKNYLKIAQNVAKKLEMKIVSCTVNVKDEENSFSIERGNTLFLDCGSGVDGKKLSFTVKETPKSIKISWDNEE